MNDFDEVLQRITPWLDEFNRAGLAALSPLQVVGVGVWMLEAEVNNGGFDQYYFNSAGDLAVPTVAALRALGAAGTAELLASANAEFPGGQPPADRFERQKALERIGDSARFEALERVFYRDEDGLLGKLAAYLRTHGDDDGEAVDRDG